MQPPSRALHSLLNNLPQLVSFRAVPAEWQEKLVPDCFAALPADFLINTREAAKSVPCRNQRSCHRHHVIEQKRDGSLVAYCENDLHCPPFKITSEERLVWRIDLPNILRGVAEQLGVDPSPEQLTGTNEVWFVGKILGREIAVFISLGQTAVAVRQAADSIIARRNSGFLLFAPSKVHSSEAVRETVATSGGHFAILSDFITLGASRKLVVKKAIADIWPDTGRQSDPANYFWRRDGAWEIRFNGSKPTILHKSEKGCAYLHLLIKNQGERLSPRELSDGVNAISADFVTGDRTDSNEFESGYGISEGLPRRDGGDILTEEGKARIQAELMELNKSLEEAKRRGDDDERAKIENEIEAIVLALARMVGRNGVSRKMQDKLKNERDAIRNSINRAIKEIEKHLPEFAIHLRDRKCLRLGVENSYDPVGQIVWSCQPLTTGSTTPRPAK